ncbi:hypothetical protein [Zooshikella sp. RANM57]|uniref:hypothetical protein n=1 Tax=Zooshikella sp. RANM57 TaxID=3425863 RepID=UPI003D6FEF77
MKVNKVVSKFFLIASLSTSLAANASIIIDNNTGGYYNDGIGDMADYYGPSQFPGANISEGDPVINQAVEPTTFGAAFGNDWLHGDYSGAGSTWTTVNNIPDTWKINHETAIVYEFTTSSFTDLHIDLGVDNGYYLWFDGQYISGALAPGHSNINEYNIDIANVATGDHRLQILREDHGVASDFDIKVDAKCKPTPVPAPFSIALLATGLLTISVLRKRKTML